MQATVRRGDQRKAFGFFAVHLACLDEELEPKRRAPRLTAEDIERQMRAMEQALSEEREEDV